MSRIPDTPKLIYTGQLFRRSRGLPRASRSVVDFASCSPEIGLRWHNMEGQGMAKKLDRRLFMRGNLLAALPCSAWRYEEKALLAGGTQSIPKPQGSLAGLPMGKIGSLPVSRLVCGGNLFSGFAHSRDLIYVSRLLKEHFTDAKVLETLALCESQGINTAILRVDDHILRILNAYRKQTGSKIQWIAQAKLPEKDPAADIKTAIDHGAAGVYLHGGVADELVSKGQLDMIATAVEKIKAGGVLAGVAGHMLEVPVACEKARLGVDFYMKTLNSQSYWSAGPMPRNDSVWEETPKETIAFMANVRKPWIAYKVLGAGAIHPGEGFKYAFQNGADFICVGMFDFQVVENVGIASAAVSAAQRRSRAWWA
jgi:hypothetical protein